MCVCVCVCVAVDARGEDSGHIGCRRLPSENSMFIRLYVHGKLLFSLSVRSSSVVRCIVSLLQMLNSFLFFRLLLFRLYPPQLDFSYVDRSVNNTIYRTLSICVQHLIYDQQ